MISLGLHHGGHFIRHGPHAFADLGVTRQAALQAYVHVPIFISLDPRVSFHLCLPDHRASFHGGMDLITSTVKKSRIDKDDAFGSCSNTFFEIDSCAAFLIHDADLHRTGRHV